MFCQPFGGDSLRALPFSDRAARIGGEMRNNKLTVGAVVLSMLAIVGIQATAGNATAYTLTESVVYTEGIGVDGLYVTPNTATFPYSFVAPAANVEVDWSDDIIFHQFPVGQKVRTEVVLHDLDLGAAVYTLSAHFKIQAISALGGDPVGTVIYESSIIEGLWLDGPSDAYTAEVNSLGNLLYGYNWETRGLQSGWYRMTFWIDETPATDGFDNPVVYHGVDLTSGAAGDTDPTAGTIYASVGYDLGSDVCWLDMFLYPKTSGRK